jgi:hypothetical protein
MSLVSDPFHLKHNTVFNEPLKNGRGWIGFSRTSRRNKRAIFTHRLLSTLHLKRFFNKNGKFEIRQKSMNGKDSTRYEVIGRFHGKRVADFILH